MPAAGESSDEESVPPPSAHTGLSRQLAFSMTIGQLGESLFGSNILQPGVVRILNGAGETLHHATQMASLQIPRMLYYQTGDLETFNHISSVLDASAHDDVLTRDSEARLRLVSAFHKNHQKTAFFEVIFVIICGHVLAHRPVT